MKTCPLKYRYIKISDYYLCLEQPLSFLAWLLFFRVDALSQIHWVYRTYPQNIFYKLLAWIRYKRRDLKKASTIFLMFVLYKFGFKKAKFTIELPIYGHLCIPVHKGYKIFNLYKKTVTKLFDKDTDRITISKEIALLKVISRIDFAPSLITYNVTEHWYEEEFINGSKEALKNTGSETLLKKFKKDISPCLEYLSAFKSPLIKGLREYTKELSEAFDANKLLEWGFNKKESNYINTFVIKILQALNGLHDRQIFLVYSHGDFCPANMFYTKKGMKIIDWEGAANRSVLFDFYSYFFYRGLSGKVDIHRLSEEINRALQFYKSKLSSKYPDICRSIDESEEIYRWLYYLERLLMLIERKQTDRNLDMSVYISKYISSYYLYEKTKDGNVENPVNLPQSVKVKGSFKDLIISSGGLKW